MIPTAHASSFTLQYFRYHVCAVPSTAVFCSESIECFPGIVSKFFLKLLVPSQWLQLLLVQSYISGSTIVASLYTNSRILTTFPLPFALLLLLLGCYYICLANPQFVGLYCPYLCNIYRSYEYVTSQSHTEIFCNY